MIQKAKAYTLAKLQAPLTPDQNIILVYESILRVHDAWHTLVKRLRYWYEWADAPLSLQTENHEHFVDKVAQQPCQAPFDAQQYALLQQLVQDIQALQATKQRYEQYNKALIQQHMPHLHKVVGEALTAQLLYTYGSLRQLAYKSASSVQIVGSKQALLDHIIKHKPCPKHGLIYVHPSIAQAPKKQRGKIARQLANAIVIAARKDYFQ